MRLVAASMDSDQKDRAEPLGRGGSGAGESGAGQPGAGESGVGKVVAGKLEEVKSRVDQLRGLAGRRTTVGAGEAVKAVAQDATALVRAEIALAKAEVASSVQAKGMGAGLLVGAAAAGWLAVQGLLLTLGFVLALFLPGWAAALIVTVLLLVLAAVAGLIAKRLLAKPVQLDQTKRNLERDVATARAHLPGRAA